MDNSRVIVITTAAAVVVVVVMVAITILTSHAVIRWLP